MHIGFIFYPFFKSTHPVKNKQDQHSFFFATCPSNMASASDWITDSKLFPDPSLNEVSTLLPIICLSAVIVVSQKDIALGVTHSNSPLSFIILWRESRRKQSWSAIHSIAAWLLQSWVSIFHLSVEEPALRWRRLKHPEELYYFLSTCRKNWRRYPGFVIVHC